MIVLYGGPSANARKPAIMLEELGLAYDLNVIDFASGDQRAPAFLAVNPNGKIPALVDPDGPGGQRVTVWESGAILLYLAEKTGRLIPAEPQARWDAMTWLFWQVSGLGPAFGPMMWSRQLTEEQAPGVARRMRGEFERNLGVLDARLAGRDFIAGEYSIADIAVYPYMQNLPMAAITLDAYPNIARWAEIMAARPAVQRGSRPPLSRAD